MCGCDKDCLAEQTQQDSTSLGLVQNDEVICRFVYEPTDIKDGKFVPFKKEDLLGCNLSAYRSRNDRDFQEILRIGLSRRLTRGGETKRLFKILRSQCGILRSWRVPQDKGEYSGYRAFCVLDLRQGFEELHITIGCPCNVSKAVVVWIRQTLLEVMEQDAFIVGC